ncbi:unnamed protein product [Effrenium voratum]|nr:unnamed protein product [Effrenium voratum]
MSNALRHLEAAKSSAVGGFAHKHLEEFQKQMSRYPAAVHPVPESFEAMGEETSEVLLPLGFTGPLQPLKRHAVLRSFQDDSEASEEEAITFEPALSEPEPIPEKPPAQAVSLSGGPNRFQLVRNGDWHQSIFPATANADPSAEIEGPTDRRDRYWLVSGTSGQSLKIIFTRTVDAEGKSKMRVSWEKL